MLDLSKFEGFQWDGGNGTKSWLKHEVSQEECEEAFFNRPLLLLPDVPHSQSEVRFFALGKTNAGRLLSIVFAARGNLIRVISARPMSRAERRRYAEEGA